MTKNSTEREIAISEHELEAMTADLVEAHEALYPKMNQAVEDWKHDDDRMAVRPFSRRGFLATAGTVVAGGLVLAAAGPAASSVRPGSARAVGGATMLDSEESARKTDTASVPLDVTVAALAASLENLAVATYSAGLKAATAGKLGKVPPAVATFAVTARAQHAQHGAAWNAIVRSAGYHPIKAVDPVVGKIVNADFSRVHDVVGLADLALTLENVAGATYLEAIAAISSPGAIAIAASIQPVEMQHAAILNFVLGKYPVPAAFSTRVEARPVSDVASLAITRA